MAQLEALFKQNGGQEEYTPASAVTAGQIIRLPDGRAAVAKTDLAASEKGAVYTSGIFDVKVATGVTFDIGAPVIWDASADTAIASRANYDDFLLGNCVVAKTTELVVRVDLNVFDPILLDRVIENVSISGGSKTLDIEDANKVINITAGHASNVVTLPAVAAAMNFIIRVGASGQRVAIDPNSNDKIMGPDVAGADNTDWICAAATSVIGDFIELRYANADGYQIVRQRGIWASA
jgi:predicted RecA/RadA family phage recombinase